MLTEIEWWGGLLFIWMAGCYALVHSTFKTRSKLSAEFVITQIAFIASAFVLALFFYPLNTALWQIVYICAIGLGIVASVLFAFWPETDEDQSNEGDDKAAEEEDDKNFEILAQLILFLPLISSFALGIYKSSDFIGTLFSLS